jgi:hypothetical protein
VALPIYYSDKQDETIKKIIVYQPELDTSHFGSTAGFIWSQLHLFGNTLSSYLSKTHTKSIKLGLENSEWYLLSSELVGARSEKE